MITLNKEKYYNNSSLKLNNPQTYCKMYWSLLKSLINGKRVPITPLMSIDNKFITNFAKK